MKQTQIKMAPLAADMLLQTIGIGYAEEPDKLLDGSGFCVVNPNLNDADLCIYWIAAEESIFENSINHILAQGWTVTFPPPKLVETVGEDGQIVITEEAQYVFTD